MEQIKISIVIPVYNIESYLRQCLDSVINQTLKEIEIICVNDGSTDNSLQILEEYAEKDKRIRIFNKANGGISSARNLGMKYIKGEYTGFVDSDDWIELDMYEKLYQNAKVYDSDMVMCSAHIFDDVSKEMKYDNPYFTLECFDQTYDNCTFTHNQTEDLLFSICVTPWNKIYKSKFLDDIGVKFPDGQDFDDNSFFYETYLNASKISLVRDYLYFYRVNREGSFITSRNERYFDIVKMWDLVEDIIFKTGNEDIYIEKFSNVRISSTLYRFNQVDEKYKKKFFDIIKQNFKKMNPICINNLNALNKEEYTNILNSDTYREYELTKKINQLMKNHEEKVMQLKKVSYRQNQEIETLKREYEGKLRLKEQIIKEITSSNSWKLTDPLRKIRYKLKNFGH